MTIARNAILSLGLSLALGGAALAAPPDPATIRSWKGKCAACHGEDGKGKTPQGEKMKIADMTTAAWQKQFTDAQIKDTILKGFTRDKAGVKQEMKGLEGKLKPEQVDALVAYVRGLKK